MNCRQQSSGWHHWDPCSYCPSPLFGWWFPNHGEIGGLGFLFLFLGILLYMESLFGQQSFLFTYSTISRMAGCLMGGFICFPLQFFWDISPAPFRSGKLWSHSFLAFLSWPCWWFILATRMAMEFASEPIFLAPSLNCSLPFLLYWWIVGLALAHSFGSSSLSLPGLLPFLVQNSFC